ncbi:MAG: glutamate-5-semialdehyde dehydrogenase [Pseudomonadota bacterium]|nr:glutamate-5-semialdehyde dehydrogenase [Pseudomonadota bacterium]
MSSQSIKELCQLTKQSFKEISIASSELKNNTLQSILKNIDHLRSEIIVANKKDIDLLKSKDDAFVDRLTLNDERIDGIIESVKSVIGLEDPIGCVKNLKKMKSGISVGQMSMPLGVICMIYESRPNVTIDAAVLCLKSGNSVILRGGSESINTNMVLSKCLKNALVENKLPENCASLIEDANRDLVNELLTYDEFIDVVIPRGGKGLIELVSKISKIPVLKHLDGICHVYIDEYADLDMAHDIAMNSKTQRYGVCNAMETLLVSQKIADNFIPKVISSLFEKNVEVRGCSKTVKYNQKILKANEEDWKTEYLSPILSIKIVQSIDEAINHIEAYGSGHTDSIVSSNKDQSEKFLRNVNSSSVMVNASTRFADGFEYGLGAEIGISTNKLHARGPVGLDGLTNQKYIVLGEGNTR